MNGKRLLTNDIRAELPFTCIHLWILLCLLLFLAGCERRELTYYDAAEITLTADWSQSGMDNKDEAARGATAIFYPTNGGEPKIFLMGDYSREAIRLPEGVLQCHSFQPFLYRFQQYRFPGKRRIRNIGGY